MMHDSRISPMVTIFIPKGPIELAKSQGKMRASVYGFGLTTNNSLLMI